MHVFRKSWGGSESCFQRPRKLWYNMHILCIYLFADSCRYNIIVCDGGLYCERRSSVTS